MGLHLVPKCHGCQVILQGQIPTLALPAQALDGDAQIFSEADGIGNMPTILSKAPLFAVEGDMVKACIGR